FATWAPSLFTYYAQHLHDLLLHDMTLIMNWMTSIFVCATFNFGPRTLCFQHTDSSNLPFSWCAITALGQFDYCLGGHLVLWDLKLVINFLPGSMVLIPSAILRHSNTTICCKEKWYSFTQYMAGGLFHWVDYSYQSSEAYWNGLNNEDHLRAQAEREGWWKFGLGLFSRLHDLKSMR
ncbi:hypothetical protein ARMSODRAFT_894150, partial [Armillaria solidipes]